MRDRSTQTIDDISSHGAGRTGAGPAVVECLTGRVVSDYYLLDKLGQGGMGVVYRALDTRCARYVAVKFAIKKGRANPVLSEFLRREAHVGSVLNHPHVCAVFEVGILAGRPFVVMELMEGQTLRQRMTSSFGLEELLDWAIQICEGLGAVHASGIVHRDIKPSNIFITAAGQAKIFDFGLAIASGAADLSEETAVRQVIDGLSGKFSLIGTPAYMSPEQVLAKHLDGRSDLFSFGVVLYEMISGERPFQGITTAFLLDAVMCRSSVPILTRKPELPAGIEPIMDKLLAKDREMRYSCAAEVNADLKRLRRGLRHRAGGRHSQLTAECPGSV